MDDNRGERVECMGVASGCGEQEAGVASSGGSRISKRGGRAKRAAKFGPAHILYINGARARPSHEQNRTRTSELAKFRGGI